VTAAAQTGYRPPCAPWASRTDIEAAVALGVPLDLSYVERALSISAAEYENGTQRELAARLADAEDRYESARTDADDWKEKYRAEECEVERLRDAAVLIRLFPLAQQWPAMRVFCTQLELGELRTLRHSDAVKCYNCGRVVLHRITDAHDCGPVRYVPVEYDEWLRAIDATRGGRGVRSYGGWRVGDEFRLAEKAAFRGFREVRIVGIDGYDERRLLVAPLNRDWEAAGDPVDWLMDEYDWLKRCKDAEVLAVSLAGLRGRK